MSDKITTEQLTASREKMIRARDEYHAAMDESNRLLDLYELQEGFLTAAPNISSQH